MKGLLLGLALFAVMFTSVAFSTEALAVNSNDLYSIMDTYQKKIEQIKTDFHSSVKKINSDARESVKEGIMTIDEINMRSKIAMQDAKEDMHSAIKQAKLDARDSLFKLKTSVDASNP